MKSKRSLLFSIALLSTLAGVIHADPEPQSNVLLTKGSSDTWNADWLGIYGRTYFSMVSTDLTSWEYLPIIEFSDGDKGVGTEVEGTFRYFFRLHYTDMPTTHPEIEDFANDGIGSMMKVLMGMNPFTPIAWLDVDADGIHDTIEQFWFENLNATGGGMNDDWDGNGIRDVFEMQAGEDPTSDSTGDSARRSNFQYDSMGRLLTADAVTYSFDIEGNLESASATSSP